jgi:glutathione-specific gamma-glutamylcyclotransferase
VKPHGHKVVYEKPGDVWFFVYGSLMWDAPFPVTETRTALLRGYHRAFCVQSVIYRGTPERPGLSLGLDFGGACRGLALRVAASERDDVARYLEKRELQEDIYFCRRVSVTTPEGRISAYTFVVNRNDPIYAGKQSLEDMAVCIARASGERGPNRDYVAGTVQHLDALGIADGPIHALLRRVDEIQGKGKT